MLDKLQHWDGLHSEQHDGARNEMVWRRTDMHADFRLKNWKEGDHLEDLDIEVRIVLKKLKVACGAFSALQPVGRLYPCP